MGRKSRVNLEAPLVIALGQLARVVQRHVGKSAIIGGIAVATRGFQRVTRDIDITFSGVDLDLTKLLDEMDSVGIVPRISDPLAFAAKSQMLLLRHTDTGIEIDLSRAWLPFELEAISRASLETIAGVVVPIAQPEDLVIYKAIAWRPKDQEDIVNLVVLNRGIDFDRIRRHVTELSEDFETDRVLEFDKLVARLPRK